MGGYNLDHTATGRDANILAPWRDRAACYAMPGVMDPPGGHAEASEGRALAVCGGCPVTRECFAWVMARKDRCDPGGVCGGMTERARSKLRARVRGLRSNERAAAS